MKKASWCLRCVSWMELHIVIQIWYWDESTWANQALVNGVFFELGTGMDIPSVVYGMNITDTRA